MIVDFPASALALAGAWTVAGFAFGLVYFAMLRRTVDRYIEDRGRLRAAALMLGRFAAAAFFLGLAASQGMLPLLTGFLGFLLARSAALRAAFRRQSS